MHDCDNNGDKRKPFIIGSARRSGPFLPTVDPCTTSHGLGKDPSHNIPLPHQLTSLAFSLANQVTITL
jgi:hypothetical protein